MKAMNQPTKTLRFVFWILLGFLSTFFAEALSGASPDFFFKDFGYIGIFPIYALHSLLLAALVIRKDGRFRFANALSGRLVVWHV